jgi:hypothetical protein
LYKQIRELYDKTARKTPKLFLARSDEFVEALPADQRATFASPAYLLIVKCHLIYTRKGGDVLAASDDELVTYLESREIVNEGLNGDALKKAAMTGRLYVLLRRL